MEIGSVEIEPETLHFFINTSDFNIPQDTVEFSVRLANVVSSSGGRQDGWFLVFFFFFF